jgi:hypothetical protein
MAVVHARSTGEPGGVEATPIGGALCIMLQLVAASCGRGSAAKGSSGDDGLGPLDAALDERAGAVSGGSSGPGVPSARRPMRRYYLAYAGEHCQVFWEEAERRSEPQVVACPRELEPGERIRLSDRVCMRESRDSSRDQPVRCPAKLINREKADRDDAGLP